MSSDTPNPPGAETLPPILSPGFNSCGEERVFWRRVGAFVIDAGLLGGVGGIAAFFCFDWLASLGSGGRLLGFVVALCYFALLNSGIGGGRTLGKRIAKLEVVDRFGHPVSVGRAAARFVVMGAPWFLNGIGFANPLMATVASVAVFGIGGAIVYLFLFNRPTRQSLHDLICGTFVVRQTSPMPSAAAEIWAGHVRIVGAWLVISLLLPLVGLRLIKSEQLSELATLRERLMMIPDCRDATVLAGTNWSYLNGEQRETKYLQVAIRMRVRPVDYEVKAQTAATIALQSYPFAHQVDAIAVTVRYGYDIGISQTWIDRRFNRTPAEWEQRGREQELRTTRIAPATLLLFASSRR